MTQIETVLSAQSTFGRDGAMFESLLGFVAELSVVLWGMVILTAVIRFVGIRIYRRGAASESLVEPLPPSGAGPAAAAPTTASGIELVQPAVGHRAPRNRRVEPRTAAQVPALANSTEP